MVPDTFQSSALCEFVPFTQLSIHDQLGKITTGTKYISAIDFPNAFFHIICDKSAETVGFNHIICVVTIILNAYLGLSSMQGVTTRSRTELSMVTSPMETKMILRVQKLVLILPLAL